MAAVSVLQGLLLIGAGVAVPDVSPRDPMATDLEAPDRSAAREGGRDLDRRAKAITARVAKQTERVDQAVSGTIDRVDETAARVRETVHDKVSQAAGVVRGVRAVIMSLLRHESHA
jgi:hypothetical protein